VREEWVCEGVAARHRLHPRGQRPCSPFVLMPPSPVISTKPRYQEGSLPRGLANKTPRATHTSDLPDTQRETLQPLISPPRSGSDGRLPDLRAPLQAMVSVTPNGCTGCILPGDPRCGEAASNTAPRKARKTGRGSDEAANPGRVLFLVY